VTEESDSVDVSVSYRTDRPGFRFFNQIGPSRPAGKPHSPQTAAEDGPQCATASADMWLALRR
jgi:hypothetical protein